MRLSASDIREVKLLKYYRLIRKWACKTYNLKDADLELLIYLDCKNRFTRNEFIDGTYTYSWDKQRWERLRKAGWIEVWRHRNRTTIKYSIFKTSFKPNEPVISVSVPNEPLLAWTVKSTFALLLITSSEAASLPITTVVAAV